jgi:hypothetical protein
MSLDYLLLFPPPKALTYEARAAALVSELPSLWLHEYQAMCSHVPNVLQFDVEGFQHLFDFTSDPKEDGQAAATEDRLVAVFGHSRAPSAGRDSSRMRGFLGGRLTATEGSLLDKGHFIGHSLGGGTDVNLFPQRPELNRGWSDPGKVFRRMERHAAGNPGTFIFARPLYNDSTWHPYSLEYGLLMPDLRLWVEHFAN